MTRRTGCEGKDEEEGKGEGRKGGKKVYSVVVAELGNGAGSFLLHNGDAPQVACTTGPGREAARQCSCCLSAQLMRLAKRLDNSLLGSVSSVSSMCVWTWWWEWMVLVLSEVGR